ncbi:MAG: glycosyltransferase family 4 protein [Clostridia bacterium]
MKVLFVTNGYPTTKHPEYCVFTKEQIESVQKYGNFDSELFFINAREKGVLEYIRCIPSLKKKLSNCDIIHCFHGLTLLLVFALSPKKKIIISFLNSIENEFGEKKFLSKTLIRITKWIIKHNNVKKIFKDKIPIKYTDNSYYLPNGVDTNKFFSIPKNDAKKELNLDINKRYILFVSSKDKYRKQKRYDRFTEVLKLLKFDFPNIEELVLVNEPRDRIIYYFNSAELHLLTSDFEGSPNSVKEAMACNLPVVATNTGNVSDMLNKVNNCYVSKKFDIEELTSYCRKILSAPITDFKINKTIGIKGLDMKSKALELISIYNKVYSS